MVTYATPLRYGRAGCFGHHGSPMPSPAAAGSPPGPGEAILTGMTDPTEFELVSGQWSAIVSSRGASLRGLSYDGSPVVTGYRGAANKQGGQGDVLIPFPGRVAGGRYRWDGLDYQLPITDKDGPNAIHGFVRTVDWQVESRTLFAIAFSYRFAGAPGYPFPLTLRIEYSLDANGLQVDTIISNTGALDAPVAMGFHPYFTVGSPRVDSDTLTLPFSDVLEFERLIPTGRVMTVAEAGLDFRLPRVIGSTQFNHCFATPTRGADGLARVRLNYGLRAFALWMDESFNYCVIYTGDALPPGVARSSIAIEPMTCGSDAFNHHDWGLQRLNIGSTITAQWGVTFG
jgi:aldose 1-epimerase